MKVNNSAGCRLSSTSLLACGRPGSAIAAAISGETACAPRTVAVDDSNKAVMAAARRAVRFVIFDPPGIRRRTVSARIIVQKRLVFIGRGAIHTAHQFFVAASAW